MKPTRLRAAVIIIGLLVIAVFSLMLLSCHQGEDSIRKRSDTGPAYGDIMVEGSIGDASNLIPLLASDSTSHGIAGMVYNGLVKYDKDMKIIGDLAESWDISAG